MIVEKDGFRRQSDGVRVHLGDKVYIHPLKITGSDVLKIMGKTGVLLSVLTSEEEIECSFSIQYKVVGIIEVQDGIYTVPIPWLRSAERR